VTQDLRKEFEPLLISPSGCHLDRDLCRASWDKWDKERERDWWRQQVVRADTWLRLCQPTKRFNKRIGTSYGLKHQVERWWRCRNSKDVYVSNGCFLMAAHRLGFRMKPVEARYCAAGGYIWDCHNAYLNISSRVAFEDDDEDDDDRLRPARAGISRDAV
jgi:hypothetical protein